MADKITILGSGSCNLIPEKAAASVLIEKGSLRLVYDFGRGTAIRLVEAGFKQDDIEHIFISHFHPDHVTDLYPYLHAASWSQIDARTKGVTIYGPEGTEGFLGKMFSVFGWSELGKNFKVTVKDVHDELNIEGETITVSDLKHSYGLRFDDIAIAGDASLNDSLVQHIASAKLAIFDAGHLTTNEICELAARTQVRQLVCSHQYGALDAVELNKKAKMRGYSGEIIVAHDLMEFEF